MKFTDEEVQVARQLFGLPEKCEFGMPDSLPEGAESILQDILASTASELDKDKMAMKLVGFTSLTSLLNARTICQAYNNNVTQGLFYMAKESMDSKEGSKVFDKADPKMKGLITQVLEELKNGTYH